MGRESAIGEKLRQLRRKAGLTLAQLAERAEIDLATVHRIEVGTSKFPRWDVVVRLAEAVGVTPDSFLADPEPPTPPPTRPRRRKPK